jgi:hypothetical protein
MAKACLTHKDRAAATMCRQCHKPVCAACTLVTSQGSFCSTECSLLFKSFQAQWKSGAAARPGGLLKTAVGLLFVGVLLVLAVHLMARAGIPAAKKIDVVGAVLEAARGSGGGAR